MKGWWLAIVLALVAFGAVAVWWRADDGRRTGSVSAPSAAREVVAPRDQGQTTGWTSWRPWESTPDLAGPRAPRALDARTPEADVEAAVRATFAAYNEHRQQGFLDGWTDRGFAQWFGVPKASVGPVVILASDLGPFAYRVGDFANTRVGGLDAMTEVELDEGQVRQRRRLALVKTDERWQIDDSENLPTPFARGASVVDVTAKWYRFQFDSRRITPGPVAFRVRNADRNQHQLLLMKQNADAGEERLVGAVGPIEPGGSATLTIADLKPGQYVMVCNLLDPAKLPYAYGMRAEFTVY